MATLAPNVSGASEVSIGDINQDGLDDIIACSRFSNDVLFIQNDLPNGILPAKRITSVEDEPIGNAIGDINLDGQADIIISPFKANYAVILENNIEADTFYQHEIEFSFDQYNNAEVADLDQDNDLDLVVSHKTGLTIFWNVNPSTWTFSPELLFTNASTGVTRLADMDGDYDIDIVCTNVPGGKLLFFENQLPTGVNSAQAIPVRCFPNPTSGLFQVEPGEQSGRLDVLTMTGQVKGIYPLDNGNIDLSFLPAGLYLMQLYNDEGRFIGSCRVARH
jgi:hypothetical protein